MIQTPASVHALIDQCMLRDQHRLRRRIRDLKRDGNVLAATDPKLDKLLTAVQASAQVREQRQQQVPKPEYPDALPVVSKRDAILDAISKHQVIIICGETGSGKTTQIPKMCLEAGLGVTGLIGHTQPRRIAARSVAARIASELNTTVGEAVGFRIRFSDQVSERTYVKLMTDGILLAEIQNDPWLNQYDTIIIDEAHERSLNIDFLLGYLKQLLPKRPTLKVIITSATIDPDRFSRHFDQAPVILAEGRGFPVEVRWRPPEEMTAEADTDSDEIDTPTAVLNAATELLTERIRDILVFLPGERDIREVADTLQKQAKFNKLFRPVEVLPLFSRLSNAEQNQIFKPGNRPRIVLATNVAETSLTVPGIRAVIDVGLARMSRYSVRSKVQRLPIEKVSQASANQRMGRCGREAPGVCIRLYSEEDFAARAEFTEPEIIRTNLAAVILQMASMRLGKVEDFPFIEPPALKLVNDGYRTLQELAALNESRKLTAIGKQIAQIPIDPRLARILLAARDEGCVSEILTIVSALSVQDPRDRPFDKRQAADELHAEFQDERSDFLAWLNLWSFIDVQRKNLSNSQFRKMCRQRFLAPMRIREWVEVRTQLQQQCRNLKLIFNDTEAPYDNIHRALLHGLLSNVAVKTDNRDFLGTRNRHLQIFPGSALFKKNPKWIVSGEISETSRLYARQVAGISVDWIERLAGHLLQYSYRDPHWSRKAGVVSAYEQSTLYGLIINPKKRVNYAPHNAAMAREIFIREGLVGGAMNSRGKFLAHNLALMDEVTGLEEKSRRRDIVVDPEELVRFYDALLPDDINTTTAFETWRRNVEADTPKILYFSRDMLIRDDAETVDTHQFPESMEFGSLTVPLTYHFAPGEDRDGVTLVVPVELVNRLERNRCEWLVPGMIEDRIAALIKSLPKAYRKHFVPAPDFARALTESMPFAEGALRQAMATQLLRMTGVDVPVAEFDVQSLPAHLNMRFEVTDADGLVLETSRDLSALQKNYVSTVESSLLQFSHNSIERDNVIDWNFGDLPESVEIQKGGISMQGHPALVAESEALDSEVSIKLFATPEKAAAAMRSGLRALYRRVLSDEVRYLKRKLPDINLLSLRFAPFGTKELLVADIINAAVDKTFIEAAPFPREREQFQQLLTQHRKELVGHASAICEDLSQVFEQHRLLSKRLDGSVSLSWVEPVKDIRDQIEGLLFPGFVSVTGADRLRRLSVYFQAINKRLDGIDKSPDKDRRRRAELLPVWERFKHLPTYREAPPNYVELHQGIRWSFEELRVSLFAEGLGTIEKVSVSRLENRIDALNALNHD